MSDSDEEYVAELSDDERDEDLDEDNDEDELDVRPGAAPASTGGRRAGTSRRGARRKKPRKGQEWEVARTWESLVEGADGTISAAVGDIVEASKRKR